MSTTRIFGRFDGENVSGSFGGGGNVSSFGSSVSFGESNVRGSDAMVYK